MLPTLITAALAITGTLLGAIVSGRFQERAAERAAHITHSEAVRRDRLEAVTALACAVSDHRRAMWMRGDAILEELPAARKQTLLDESHMTRSAVTRPLVAVRVLIEDQAVRAAAERMITLTYAMHDSWSSRQALTDAREGAKVAHDDFLDVAARYLGSAA
ncbi:hypothetical protein [Streptomyces sp. Ac-502]|uniref:hypothetical protein n=1 Tax=Streptomyces sp. Ac-502 TaxID=3342801 RepID=UPI003862B63F